MVVRKDFMIAVRGEVGYISHADAGTAACVSVPAARYTERRRVGGRNSQLSKRETIGR